LTQSAAKAFTNMVVHIGKRQGITGIALTYVVHCTLKGPINVDSDDETKAPPLFGQPKTTYFSINNKLIARAPILRHDLTTSLRQALRPSKVMGLLSPVS
jgi:hypothetical protein